MSLRKLPEIKAFQGYDALTFEPPESTLEAFDPNVVAVEESENTITIFGKIGLDPLTATDNTERRVAAALRAIGREDVNVNINSPGGNFFNGMGMYNVLRAHPARVTINVMGMAGSAASIVAMAGDEILIADGSFIMVHNSSAVTLGNKYDTADATEILNEIDGAMADVYAARSGADRDDAIAWMDRHRGVGTMFNASRAIEVGLADARLDANKVKVTAEMPKAVPAERVIENALVVAGSHSPKEAKAFLAEFKSGTRDAAKPGTRDAAKVTAALKRLQQTIRS